MRCAWLLPALALAAGASASPAAATMARGHRTAGPHAQSAARRGARRARRAALGGSSLHAQDVASLHYVQAVGEQVYETGSASGTLPGGMRVHMIFASTFSGSFTIYTRDGRIDGHGRARPHGGGIYESFAGTLRVTGGTGRYRHAHGTARLYGTFNRDNYALKIRTAGTLRY